MRISDWSSDVFSSDLHDFAGGDIRFSELLVLVYRSQALVGEEFGDEVAFVGPALAHRLERADFSWERLSGQRRVLVSLGDRKSVVLGKSVSVRVALVGRRIIKNKQIIT